MKTNLTSRLKNVLHVFFLGFAGLITAGFVGGVSYFIGDLAFRILSNEARFVVGGLIFVYVLGLGIRWILAFKNDS